MVHRRHGGGGGGGRNINSAHAQSVVVVKICLRSSLVLEPLQLLSSF